MMRKCEWCHKKDVELKIITLPVKTGFSSNLQDKTFFVCPEHETKLRKFNDRVRRFALLFTGLNALLVLCLVVSAFWLDSNNYMLGYLFGTSEKL